MKVEWQSLLTSDRWRCFWVESQSQSADQDRRQFCHKREWWVCDHAVNPYCRTCRGDWCRWWSSCTRSRSTSPSRQDVGRTDLIPLAISSFVYSIQLECLLRTELYITLLRGPEARHSSTLYISLYNKECLYVLCATNLPLPAKISFLHLMFWEICFWMKGRKL